MSATTVEAPRPHAEPIEVNVPPHSFASELRAIRIVWRRDLIRFGNDRVRMISTLVQPLLFLFVLGSGLQTLSRASTHGVNLKTFIYPGILCIAVMFTAMFSAASIVWDREFGFLREMLVAPVPGPDAAYSVALNSQIATPIISRPMARTIPASSSPGTCQPHQLTPGFRTCRATGEMSRSLNTSFFIGSTAYVSGSIRFRTSSHRGKPATGNSAP